MQNEYEGLRAFLGRKNTVKGAIWTIRVNLISAGKTLHDSKRMGRKLLRPDLTLLNRTKEIGLTERTGKLDVVEAYSRILCTN